MVGERISGSGGLLDRGDPPVVEISGPVGGSAPFVLLGDHAGDALPRSLNQLGLSPADRSRHIAVDIGSHRLGLELSERLGAPFVSQTYSRLVIDCNRAPDRPDAIPETSDGTPVPGNRKLSPAARQARIGEVHEPYHAAIAELLDRRARAAVRTLLVSVHSFTPIFGGSSRPWQVGVLHDANAFAQKVLAQMQAQGEYVIGDNEPYRFDATDYTIPRHAFPRKLDWVELEIRQDLLADRVATTRMADLLARMLDAALQE